MGTINKPPETPIKKSIILAKITVSVKLKTIINTPIKKAGILALLR